MKKLFLVAAILAAISTQHASAEGSLSIVIPDYFASDCSNCNSPKVVKIQFSADANGVVKSTIVESTGSKASDERVAATLEESLTDMSAVKPGVKYAPVAVSVSWYGKIDGCLAQLPTGPLIDIQIRCGSKDLELLDAVRFW